jgi:hypothetical protein
MINFLLWTMPLLGPSIAVVPSLAFTLIIIALSINKDRFGSWIVSFVVIMLLVWGIWIGLYHVYPVIQ